MPRIHITTPFLLLLLGILAITLASCALKYEWLFWHLQIPDVTTPTDSARYKFQFGNVVFTVYDQILGSRVFSIGPPYMPFIPVSKPESPFDFYFNLTVDSALDTTRIDFSQVRIESLPGKIVSRVKTISRVIPETPKSEKEKMKRIEVPISMEVISSEKRTYYLTFGDLPSNTDEIVLILGKIEIGEKEHEVPTLRYHLSKKGEYDPVHFH